MSDETNISVGTVFSLATLNDIRDKVRKHHLTPQLGFVRVSDGWWVSLENGVPKTYIPHNDLMRIIEEHVPVKTQVAGSGVAGFAGNVLIGGVIGMGADAYTGATLEHVPNPVFVTLRPVPPPPLATTRAAPKPRKPAPQS